MNALESRKQMLIAESELNRAQLIQDWQAMAGGARRAADHARSIRTLAMTALALVSGLMSFRKRKPTPAKEKFSWWQALLKGAQLAGSLWADPGPRTKS